MLLSVKFFLLLFHRCGYISHLANVSLFIIPDSAQERPHFDVFCCDFFLFTCLKSTNYILLMIHEFSFEGSRKKSLLPKTINHDSSEWSSQGNQIHFQRKEIEIFKQITSS